MRSRVAGWLCTLAILTPCRARYIYDEARIEAERASVVQLRAEGQGQNDESYDGTGGVADVEDIDWDPTGLIEQDIGPEVAGCPSDGCPNEEYCDHSSETCKKCGGEQSDEKCKKACEDDSHAKHHQCKKCGECGSTEEDPGCMMPENDDQCQEGCNPSADEHCSTSLEGQNYCCQNHCVLSGEEGEDPQCVYQDIG